MNIEDAKKAILYRIIVQHKDDPDRWGFITCLSDDESTAYIRKNGIQLIRYSITLDKIEFPK